MVTEVELGREREPKQEDIVIVLRGWGPGNIDNLNLTELRRYLNLAHEVKTIVSSFPTQLFPGPTSTELIFPRDEKPTIIHNTYVAYKYHPYGGRNSIRIQEGEGVEREKQINLSFEGHTTSFNTVSVVTERSRLREGLKELISIGRELGGESELKSHGVNHPTTVYCPKFLL